MIFASGFGAPPNVVDNLVFSYWDWDLGKRLEMPNYALFICCYRIKNYELVTLWV